MFIANSNKDVKKKEEKEILKEIERITINVTPDGGVRKIIMVPGDGPIPQKGQKVAIHYNVTLVDGTVVGDTFENKIPLKLTIGGETSIPGVELAVATMRFGEKSRLEVEPKYAFGEMDNVHGFHGHGVRIPPNSALIFVELHLLPLELALPKSTAQWVETAESSKQAGNKAFQDGEDEKAKTEYENVLKIVDCVKKQLDSPNLEGKTEQEKQKIEKEKKDNEKKIEALYIAAHLNSAAVALRQRRYDDAKEHSRKVIEREPNNAKAYYRLAKAHKEVNQFELAIESLETALKIHDSSDLVKELNECKHLNEEKLQREKVAYRNMFSKLRKEEGLYDGVKPAPPPTWKCYYCGEEMDEVQRARHIIKKHSGENKQKITNKDLGLPDKIPLDLKAKEN